MIDHPGGSNNQKFSRKDKENRTLFDFGQRHEEGAETIAI
jgi:hypothetical protein